ncbi:YczE/YyaS/YitT family protein [Vagococcus acidifermentans]|uniref:YitT family protein n=1 Tax=Vagococcus acidifermentans TaxID=564710 RepID=A0A430B0T6_9ENTE|nr:hypothetical protein [Vagococcus acidifermentans]RSU13861.1 hypothetical protein CBF27_02880 [Vagococcus acidifermentans]
MKNSDLAVRFLFALTGVIFIAFGSGVLRAGNVGIDPLTACGFALSHQLGISLGVFMLGFNISVLIVIFFFGKKYIGLGTIVNMTLIGFLIEHFYHLIADAITFSLTLLWQAAFLILGILIFTFGISLYMTAQLGISPYDAISPVIVDQTHVKFKIVRIIQDTLAAVIAIIFGGPVGIGTIISAFFTGPLIDFWNERAAKPLMKRLTGG